VRVVALILVGGLVAAAPEQERFRTYNDRFRVPEYASPAEWRQRAAWLREHILATAGLQPMPAKTALRAQVFDERSREGYSVFKAYFESLPGFYVTGNLYRPPGPGPFPAILSPHGHWAYGRLENNETASVPARAINLAEQGFVVFTYDMIGYNDSRQLPHDFGGRREYLWGLSLAGLQLWNSMRAVDFLQSLPYVDGERIGATGASGGGTQTFLLAAVDERVRVAAPVNMISLHMQGGCICENQPGLRVDANNVELAATIAPRPLLMVSATGDWTKETMEVEYPAMRRLYALAGGDGRVHAVQFEAEHNYNRDSREVVYAWMARWLKNAPADARPRERAFAAREPDRPSDLLVFYGRPLPDEARTREQIVDEWIVAARKQVETADPPQLQSALLHALALEPRSRNVPPRGRSKTVVFAGDDPALQAAVARAGFSVRRVPVTPFDEQAASAIRHFETYNRTASGQLVADIAEALRSSPDAMLVAAADAGPAAVLALAVASPERAVLDVGQFDRESDAAFLERLYIPGVRRAGDLQTALSLASGAVVIHNAGDRLALEGPRIERNKLTPAEIVTLLKQPGRHPSSRGSQTAR
jgi:hypothetical protein